MKTQEAHVGGTIGEMIVHGIDRYPDRVAFIDGDARMTYRALGDRISQAIAAFRALGLVRGDCVVQLSGNRPEVFVVMAAAYLMGLRSVTLHAMGGVDDHAYIVDDAEARVFMADPVYAERALALRERCAGVAHWFGHADVPGLPSFWDQAASFAPARLVPEALTTDVIRLAYTGGTTGKPKGVMLANRCVWMQAVLLLADTFQSLK